MSRPPWRSGFQQRSAHETQGLDRHGVSVCEFRINKLAITSQYQSASSHRANYQPERIPITIWRTCAPCRSPCPPPGARAEAPVARAYRTDVHADWIHPLFGPSGGASSARMHTQRAFSAVKAPEWPLEANGQNKWPRKSILRRLLWSRKLWTNSTRATKHAHTASERKTQ